METRTLGGSGVAVRARLGNIGGIEDIAAAEPCVNRARERGVGAEVEL